MFCRIVRFAVIAPFAQTVAYGQHLAFKPGAGVTDSLCTRNTSRTQVAVLLGHDHSGHLLAGSFEGIR